MMMACVSIAFLFPFLTFHPIQAQYTVTHLEKPYNTAGSETGALVVGDTVLVYATLQGQATKRQQFSFNTSIMQLYQARIARNGKTGKPRPNRWGLNHKKYHTGNLAIDPWNHDLYFTYADVETLNCEIFYARKLKRGWQKPVPLKGGVNLRGYTSTQPSVGRLADSTVILYFASNRAGGMGGMDIWYTLVKNGVAGECVNLGPQVNSTADEITPYYDQPNGVLYFSSDREGGLGGHDIYCAVGQRNTWQKAEPVCLCLNSAQNDIYFTISHRDSVTGMPIAGYLASNRPDSYFLTDSTCCNDIYEWKVDSVKWKEEVDTAIVAQQDSAHLSPLTSHLSPFRFPLSLYFHNDEPDPRSRESTTTANYADCQRRYAALRKTYLEHQTNATDSALIETFFDSCIVGNFNRVELLFDHIEEMLDEGRNVELTVSGYASPLFTDDYNRTLSDRRIGSFINMIRAGRGGLFADAIDDGRLTIVQQSMGVEKLSTPNSQISTSKDPVYSFNAARARRIEILGCEIR